MVAILGIGNPGRKYENTRHNIGFIILDTFARIHNLNFIPSRFDFYKAEGNLFGADFVLIKPTTYVNRSGDAAIDLLDDYKIDPGELLVICDDVNLTPGKIRIRKSGGDGGHNGLNSIIYSLQTIEFPRLRFGIGENFKEGGMAGYVLDKFSSDEIKNIKPSIDFSVSLIEKFIEGGSKAMLDFFSANSNKLTNNN